MIILDSKNQTKPWITTANIPSTGNQRTKDSISFGSLLAWSFCPFTAAFNVEVVSRVVASQRLMTTIRTRVMRSYRHPVTPVPIWTSQMTLWCSLTIRTWIPANRPLSSSSKSWPSESNLIHSNSSETSSENQSNPIRVVYEGNEPSFICWCNHQVGKSRAKARLGRYRQSQTHSRWALTLSLPRKF